MNTMKSTVNLLIMLSFAVMVMTGCSAARKNLAYWPAGGGELKLAKPLTGVFVPLADDREDTKAYPKQVIVQTDFSGNVSYDINDRTVAEVLDGAVTAELGGLGVKVVKAEGIEGPLDKESAERIRNRLAADHPEAKAAFGGRIKDFIATSKRNLVTNDVHVSAWLQFYVLDARTGDLIWSDYKTEWDDVVASADRNYLIEQLDLAIVNLVQKSVRDNESMKALLTKISNRD